MDAETSTARPSMARAAVWTLIAAVVMALGALLPVIGVDNDALAELTGQSGLPMVSLLGQAPAGLVIVQSVLLIGGWQDRPRARVIALVIYLALTAIGALTLAFWLESLGASFYLSVVEEPGWQFRVTVVLSMLALAAILWWISDRISSTSAAHGALAIALVDGALRTPFAASSASEAFARGSATLVTVIAALLPAIVVVVLGVVVLVRPATWPVALTKRFSLRSWIDLAGAPLAVRVVLTQPLSTSLVAATATGQGAPGLMELVLPLGLVAATIALAAVYVKKAAGGAKKSTGALVVGGIVALVSFSAAAVSFATNDGFMMFDAGPLAGEQSFRFTLRAAEGRFGRNEAEAMVQRIVALGAEAEIVSESAELITLAVRNASDRESVLEAIRPQALELRLVVPSPDFVALPTGAERGFDETIQGSCPVVEDLARTITCRAAIERQTDEEGSVSCLLHCLEDEVVLDSDGVEEARVEVDPNFGEPMVMVTLTDEAAERFGAVTGANIQRKLAIVVDGEVVSAPVIQTAIPGGSIQITMGNMGSYEETFEEAHILATALSVGKELRTPWVLESEG